MDEPERGEPVSQNGQASAPPWMPWFLRQVTIRGVLALIAGIWGVMLITDLTSKLSSMIGILFTAFFLSFAIEPAVNWLASRGWRRGSATGLIFLGVFIACVILVALVIPAVISGTKQLIAAAPDLVRTFVRFADRFGWHISADNLTTQIEQHAQQLVGSAASLAGNVFGIAASILGGIFRWATIALFTFYIVAEGPKLRRIICSALPPRQQAHILFVWDQAIEKTGGYFYSRLLLAVINGTGMYITLRVFSVPFAAPLAIFEGLVAEFIPIVGTYIAGAAPVFVALLSSTTAGIAALAYVLIYQQIENYLLSPRLTEKTMALHPAVAFAAALIGGAIGGILTAFLALPVAGVIQAAIQEYGKRYTVVEDGLTAESAPLLPKGDKPGMVERFRERKNKDDGPDA
ncbi:MAG: AI-2E family transporter [Actinomycetota bacterium]